ncbi:NADP-dependent phosphogluconate dehydrogenase [Gramella sp. KN1008]|nr:NADP-dependent phosphogluconate dehydrogenase [Gramella sp. KN1008]
MGVSGVGKTTLGKALASKLNLNFYDGDDFHPQENILKMKNGKPLTDGDREGWLKNISDKMNECPNGAVFTCSALKEKYRRFIEENSETLIHWIFLYESFDVIHERMKNRQDHFFKPEMLKSQFDILEQPKYGLHIKVNASPEETLKNLMRKIEMPQIGIIGLGVMGKNLALNMAEKGIQVSVYNREVEGEEEGIAENFYKENQEYFDFHHFSNLTEFVNSLPVPRNLILMVKAGNAVDSVMNELSPLLEKDDLIMDGGNSHFKDTERRISELKKKGILYLGIGISGGEEGARKGPSIMPGGSMKAYERVKKLLDAIAANDVKGVGCCTYISSGGSGHFVKMVHNGIEYGEMQLIAEFYHFMRFYLQFEPRQIAKLFKEWNKELNSYLLEITIDILQKKENKELLLDLILDVAGQKGTGGWSTQSALELGVPLDTITSAVMARNISAYKGRRNSAHKAYRTSHDNSLETSINEYLLPAFRTTQIINHAIGFDLLEKASAEYNWNLNLSEIARVWTNGCIIRSGLMESLVKIFRRSSDHLLINPGIIPEIKDNRQSLSIIVSEAIKLNCPIPVSSAAINYLNNFVSAQSSANIIQAQRDYFGTHTYERTDRVRGQFYHTKWK